MVFRKHDGGIGTETFFTAYTFDEVAEVTRHTVRPLLLQLVGNSGNDACASASTSVRTKLSLLSSRKRKMRRNLIFVVRLNRAHRTERPRARDRFFCHVAGHGAVVAPLYRRNFLHYVNLHAKWTLLRRLSAACEELGSLKFRGARVPRSKRQSSRRGSFLPIFRSSCRFISLYAYLKRISINAQSWREACHAYAKASSVLESLIWRSLYRFTVYYPRSSRYAV